MTKVLLLCLALGRGGCTSTIAARELVPIKGIYVRSHPAGLSMPSLLPPQSFFALEAALSAVEGLDGRAING